MGWPKVMWKFHSSQLTLMYMQYPHRVFLDTIKHRHPYGFVLFQLLFVSNWVNWMHFSLSCLGSNRRRLSQHKLIDWMKQSSSYSGWVLSLNCGKGPKIKKRESMVFYHTLLKLLSVSFLLRNAFNILTYFWLNATTCLYIDIDINLQVTIVSTIKA